jgi:mono/diheme cytochrome c family protein
MLRLPTFFVLVLAFPALTPAAEAKLDFNRDIRPILSDKCFQCHGPDEKTLEGDVRLDERASAVSAKAIVPGSPELSEALARVLSDDPDEVMPPPKTKKTVSPAEADILRRWIAEGAEYKGHWAFEPIATTEPPDGKHPVDHFIRAELGRKGIQPSPEADPATLIRRLSLDLTGLLPAPERVAAFLTEHQRDPDKAIEALADELLASPHYGERWGRHWLDQARYADSNGYSIDGDRTQWPYRDWVIRAINEDLPFDRFTIAQIAGDLLPNATKAQLVASGFHRNTLINQEGGTDPEQFRNEEVVDRINTTGAVWLGLTLGCAQCHTHKYDPITHREYFELFAFFNHGTDINNTGATLEVAEGELFLTDPEPAKVKAIEEAKTSLAKITAATAKRQVAWEDSELGKAASDAKETPLLLALRAKPDKRTNEQKKLLAAEFAKVDREKLAAEKNLAEARRALGLGAAVNTMVMRDLPEPRETFIHLRGSFLDHDRKTGPLSPGVPAALPPLPGDAAKKERPDRLDLANWLVRPDHPLVPRVTVNRVWMRYFGKGLVGTENDFGTQGTYPTHPELLDWLAHDFVANGWSMKRLHKLIVTSATYRQSSHARPDLAELDPLNQLLARQNRLRVEAEIVRDAALSASGLLHPKVGGPGVKPPQPEGVYAFTQNKKSWTAATGPDRYRRGLYIQFYRSAPYPLLTTFDSPDFQSVCTARVRSNTPLQSLALANDEALFELAQGLGERLLKEVPADDETRLERAFLLCYARPPSVAERNAVASFRESQLASFVKDPVAAEEVAPKGSKDPAEAASWTAVARALMNTDEFITRE